MIEVLILHKESRTELGYIEIENISPEHPELGDYVIKFAVEKISSVGIHTRGFSKFPRKKYNVLALLLQVLNTLGEEDLELSGEIDDSVLEKNRQLPRS